MTRASGSRLTGEERLAAIIKAIRRIFAEKGFHGTTTKELAAAAGVSEALLFRHFPNKKALYTAMEQACFTEEDFRKFSGLEALDPSTGTLVYLVHDLASHVIGRAGTHDDDEWIHSRLMFHSLIGDGEYARLVIQGMPTRGKQKLQACIKAAVAAGEASDTPVRSELAGLFVFHLVAMIRIHMQHEYPVVDYGVSRKKLVEQVVWFVLRGFGLTDTAIRRWYTQETLTRLSRQVSRHGSM
jgi:AcrR family transcriptional regulator